MGVKALLILNGPGLDGGARIEEACAALCRDLGMEMSFRRGNSAGELLDWITHDAPRFDAIIVNPTGLYAAAADCQSALEALAGLKKPVIEVHLSNIFQDGADAVEPLRASGAQIAIVS